jgi:type VI protein secretion system component VasK
MSIIWITIAVALVIIWVITVVDILRRHLGAKRTSAWLLIVVLLPFVGALMYWVLRKPEPGEAERLAAAERDRRDQARRRSFDSTKFGPP